MSRDVTRVTGASRYSKNRSMIDAEIVEPMDWLAGASSAMTSAPVFSSDAPIVP